ncbi:MAG: kanosamine 6-kinase, partial [Streptomyces sp.]|nr:kanosamine 6-kinase [Streptomyces sp.]
MGDAPAGRALLGIDVGGTKVALRAEDETGRSDQVVFSWPEPAGAEADWKSLTATVEDFRTGWGGDFDAVGVAMPATVGPDGQVVSWPGRPGWAGFGLGPALAQLFAGRPVGWADDGDLAALAEAAHAGCDHLVYLGVGTGVGGGIVHDGAWLPGPGRGSCEAGHIVVDRDGPRCDCGRRGCVQATAAGPATLRRAAQWRGAPVDFPALRAALAEHTTWAVRAVDESCAALAAAVVSLNELFRPELTVLGGGFATALPGFVDRVDAYTRSLARAGGPRPEIRPAALGGLSSLHG